MKQTLLLLGLLVLAACSRPETLCPEPPAPAPCVCEDCPACPAAPACPACPAPEAEAPPASDDARAPAAVPEHLRPTREQCQAACERLTQVEARRMLNRATDADPEIGDALAKGLEEERLILMDGCVKRCLHELTAAVAICVRKHGDHEAVLSCIAKSVGM